MRTHPESNISEMVSLTEFIEKEIKARNWGLKEFADHAGLPLHVVEGLIGGWQEVTHEVLQGIGKAVDTRVVKLYEDDDELESAKPLIH